MSRLCRRFWVSGKVQGVFFRASTASRANGLDLDGYAINLADGRVEVVACGAETAVTQLADWLNDGPAGSRVDQVTSEDCDFSGSGFTTG
ncbi:MAG: acylphosphatase [Gammaproteobacteria bacterium]|nr:acylphosphatase [Gammaproteobacteria bacterium]